MAQRTVRSRLSEHAGRVAAVYVVVIVLGFGLTGCTGYGDLSTASLLPATGNAGERAVSERSSGKPVGKPTLAALAHVHKERPSDVPSAIAYARALKASGDGKAARAVLDRMASRDSDQTLLVERGLLALELGDVSASRRALAAAAAKDKKDWRVLSALGVAEASSGKKAKARSYFKQALELAPDNPVVLNNMAMAYLLQGKASEAEVVLRGIAGSDAGALGQAKARVERNLALASNLTSESPAARTAGMQEKGRPAEKLVRAN